MMGAGINIIEKVVHTVLTNFTNMNIECPPKLRQLHVAEK